MHQSSLSALLFPVYRRRVLGLLLLHPEEGLHGREIARRVGLSAGTITRELNKLADAALLVRDKRGNQQVYRANTQSPVFIELASILRKTSGLADVLAAALSDLAPQIRSAFVFGSMARAQESPGSDIDLMLIGDVDFRAVVQALHPSQATLGREINPQVYTAAEFAGRLPSETFLRDVIANPKIFVIGNAHDLEELAGHQPRRSGASAGADRQAVGGRATKHR